MLWQALNFSYLRNSYISFFVLFAYHLYYHLLNTFLYLQFFKCIVIVENVTDVPFLPPIDPLYTTPPPAGLHHTVVPVQGLFIYAYTSKFFS